MVNCEKCKRNVFEHRCKVCKQFICNECYNSQCGLTKHETESLISAMASISSKLKKKEDALVKLESDFEVEANRFTIAVESMEKMETEQVASLNCYIDEVIGQLESYRELKKGQISKANRENVALLNNSTSSYKAITCEIHRQLKLINDSVKSANSVILYQTAEHIDTDGAEKINVLRNKITPVATFYFTSPVTVSRTKNLTASDFIKVDIQVKPDRPISFTELRFNDFQIVKRCNFSQFWSTKLYIIQDKLWACGSNIVEIFNFDCEKLKEKRLCDMRGLTCCSTGEVFIVSSMSGSGQLLLVDANADNVTTVANGDYSAVCAFNDAVYALKWRSRDVDVFTKTGNTWSKITPSFSLGDFYTSKSLDDRLFAGTKNIFASVYGRDHTFNIYICNPKQRHFTLLFSGSTNIMAICEIDHFENVLLASTTGLKILKRESNSDNISRETTSEDNVTLVTELLNKQLSFSERKNNYTLEGSNNPNSSGKGTIQFSGIQTSSGINVTAPSFVGGLNQSTSGTSSNPPTLGEGSGQITSRISFNPPTFDSTSRVRSNLPTFGGGSGQSTSETSSKTFKFTFGGSTKTTVSSGLNFGTTSANPPTSGTSVTVPTVGGGFGQITSGTSSNPPTFRGSNPTNRNPQTKSNLCSTGYSSLYDLLGGHSVYDAVIDETGEYVWVITLSSPSQFIKYKKVS